jgi:hypothetical protein
VVELWYSASRRLVSTGFVSLLQVSPGFASRERDLVRETGRMPHEGLTRRRRVMGQRCEEVTET